jgi:uncharacterized membrane protein
MSPKRNHDIQIAQAAYSGPLPPANQFNKYGKYVKDAPERILRMAENQQKHRIKIENKVINFNNWTQLLGSIFAFLIAIFALFFSYLASSKGESGTAIGIALAGISPIVGSFIKGRYSKKK